MNSKKKKAQDKQKGKQRRVWDEGKMGAKDAAVLDYSNDSKAAKAGGGGGEGAAGVHTEEEVRVVVLFCCKFFSLAFNVSPSSLRRASYW